MAGGVAESTTIGVTGQRWRASVSPWGSVTPWCDASIDDAVERATLDWFIAADDRWHNPAEEAAVRQRRIDGTPVVETRVRVPDGDAVQRVWSVADAGGLTIIEVENDSPLPFAIAFSGVDVLTERPPVHVPIQGIELPPGAITLPVGHHASIRVGIPHDSTRAGADGRLPRIPTATEVVSGWTSIAERASRLDLPDDGLAEAVIAARCDLMLEGPVDPSTDPIGFVLDVGELVRCGDDPTGWLAEIIGPLELSARSGDALLPSALVVGERIARLAGDSRAAGDIERLRARVTVDVPVEPIGPFSELRRTDSVGRFVREVERRLANGTDLLPAGIPTRWLGANFELHDVPTSPESTVSFTVRWHGDRPAVLWEQTGVVQPLTASAVDSDWSTAAVSGEGLWAAPVRTSAASKLAVAAQSAGAGTPQDSTSFS